MQGESCDFSADKSCKKTFQPGLSVFARTWCEAMWYPYPVLPGFQAKGILLYRAQTTSVSAISEAGTPKHALTIYLLLI